MRRFYPLLTCVISALIVSTSGCATQKPVRFSAVVCPSDKALVYVYWERWIAKLNTLEIDVNKEPRARLHTGGYYAFLFDPGPVTLGYSQRISIYPIYSKDTNALQLTLEAGKTYYVAYEAAMRWKPRLIQVDAAIAENKIKHYTLSEDWK